MQEFLDDNRDTQLGAGHLTQGAARVLCDGGFGIKTDSFFELSSCSGGIVEPLIGQSEMVSIRGIVWGFFDRVFQKRSSD